MALLSVFLLWLHRYTGDDDLVIGTPYANRDQPKSRRLMGPLINTLPLRLAFDPETREGTFVALLKRVRRLVLDGFRASLSPTPPSSLPSRCPAPPTTRRSSRSCLCCRRPRRCPSFDRFVAAPAPLVPTSWRRPFATT